MANEAETSVGTLGSTRFGILGDDWAGSWITLMDPYGMPGPDFVVYATSRDFATFTPRIGGDADGVNAMRALLIFFGDVCNLRYAVHAALLETLVSYRCQATSLA